MTNTKQSTKRFLTVGSLLRPDNLLSFKSKIEHRDDISYPFYDAFKGYKEVERKAVEDVLNKQIEHQLPELTDGEFTKSLWHLDFVWGLNGVRRYIADNGYFFRDKDQESRYETRRDIGIDIHDSLDGHNHTFIEHFKHLQDISPNGSHLKQCIPSPSHIYGELSLSGNIIGGKVYADTESFKNDLIQAYQDFLKEYAEVGGKIIQFDDCLWELFADDNPNSPFSGEEFDRQTYLDLAKEFIELNNEVIAYAHSLGLKVYTHNCRGNYDSRNMGGGSYAKIAHIFFEKQNYDRFYLEWDDERAGDLSALEVFRNKPDTEVVLGFLSSKTNTLDDEQLVLKQLEQATKYIPKDKLYLSHQCGFASCDSGNELTEDEQWSKIKQGQRIAYKFWGE
ncbi:5-methyltetrahydropteroyltriglutamate--homocysteine methyltransferase [Aerococcaceae bacterium WGS1372]